MTDLHEMDKWHELQCIYKDPNHVGPHVVSPDSPNLAPSPILELHKRIEKRITKLQQPVLGLKGGVDRKEVLQVIEEEFGRLGNL